MDGIRLDNRNLCILPLYDVCSVICSYCL